VVPPLRGKRLSEEGNAARRLRRKPEAGAEPRFVRRSDRRSHHCAAHRRLWHAFTVYQTRWDRLIGDVLVEIFLQYRGND
jgi:hypothetical protein